MAVISKVYSKIHNFSMIPLKYILNALIQTSKLHLPFIETFLWRNFVWGGKILITNVCDEKSGFKNFDIKKYKIVKKKLKCPLKIRNKIVTKLKT